MDIINSASKPIFVVGGGVRWSKAGDLIDEISKKLKIPVATSLNGKDVINANNPLNVGVVGTYSRGSANKSALAADLAIFIGTDLGPLYFQDLPAPHPQALLVSSFQAHLRAQRLRVQWLRAQQLSGQPRVG